MRVLHSGVRRLRTSGDYILSRDNWRLGISSLLATSLGLSSFKNVFWSSQSNPGNKFYYNCMEVSNQTDPNVPWSLKYRYTGYQNTTKSGPSIEFSQNSQQAPIENLNYLL